VDIIHAPIVDGIPHVESCLLVHAIFLNILWIVLGWGWITSHQKYPLRTFFGGIPSKFQLAIATMIWATILGVVAYEFEAEYWFLGFSIANGAFMSMLNPAFALSFSLTMMLMRPWEMMEANAVVLALPRFSVMFSIGWFLLYFIVYDRWALRINKLIILLFAYCTWVFLSTFITPDPASSLYSFNETIGRAVTLFIMIYHLVRDRFSVWVIKTAVINTFTCVGAISLLLYFNDYTEDGRLIAFGLFKNTNDIAAIVTISFMLAATPFLKKSSSLLEKLGAVIPMATSFLVIMLAQSRGALIAIVFPFAVHTFIKMKKKVYAVIAVSIIGIIGVTALSTLKRNAGDLEGSSESRKSFWISGLRIAMYNPVFGVGFGQFPDNFETYALKIVGEYGKRTAHSSWILALSEGGILGLILFVAFYFYGALKNSYRLYYHDPTWFYAAVSYGFAMSFLSHTYVLFPYILIGMITAAVTVFLNEEARPYLTQEMSHADGSNFS